MGRHGSNSCTNLGWTYVPPQEDWSVVHEDSNESPLCQYLAIQPDDQATLPEHPQLAITDGGQHETIDNGNDPDSAVIVVEQDTTAQAVEALADLTGSPQRRWVSASSSTAFDVMTQSVESFLGLADPFVQDDPWKSTGTSSDTSPTTTTSYEIVTDKSSQSSSPAK